MLLLQRQQGLAVRLNVPRRAFGLPQALPVSPPAVCCLGGGGGGRRSSFVVVVVVAGVGRPATFAAHTGGLLSSTTTRPRHPLSCCVRHYSVGGGSGGGGLDRPRSGASSGGGGGEEEEWIDPPHVAAAKKRLSALAAEDLYAVLGVAPDADSQDIVAAYNERGAALASAPDFSTNADLKTQLQRLKHATEVLLDPPQRLEFDAQRRSVREALRRLEVDPAWARGKEKMARVGRTFLYTKQAWAFGVFLAMMSVFTYIAIDLTRRQEEQLKRYDRTTAATETPNNSNKRPD